MPERKDSVDSFDEFFGESKRDDDRKRSPIKPKENETTIAAIVKTQPLVKRPQTPSTPEERRVSSPKTKPKVNNTKTNGYKNASPVISNRAESVQSKVYESDFDDDNGFEDDQTAVESIDERKKNSSLPPPKQRTYEAPRRGSDSELKKSYTVTRPTKPPNGNTRRKEPLLPYIRPHQARQPTYPVRRYKENVSSSAKNEAEQRALSARTNKFKSLESRIAELRRELEAQRIENSTLRTIQRREEKAIRKYEEKEYDIHRIVREYTHEIDYVKEVLSNERETKMRLEKQIEIREEKFRDQSQNLKKYQTIVQEKHLDERYELREKLIVTDKKLEEFQEKLAQQEKYIENLEKNHRHEIKQELSKQRGLKRQLEARSEKYNDLLSKLEDKTRQIDSMHIYAQRIGKNSSNLSKSRSLQSLENTSPRVQEKTNDYDKKRREQQEQERKSRARQQQSSSNDSSSKKIQPKKESQTNKNSSNDEKSSKTQNGHLPPKGKPPTRRLSTPKSVDEEENKIDDEIFFGSTPKKLPPPSNIERDEPHLSRAQIHKRPTAPISSTTESRYNASGTGGSTTASSSIFKLTEPAAPSKPRVKHDLDEKWSDMFGKTQQEDSAKEDLLAKLVADEQKERRLASNAQQPPSQRSSMNMFESSTTPKPTTTVKPSVDPFESLFSNNSNKPSVASRTNDLDDMFSTKPSNQSTTQTKQDQFDSLFGPSSTTVTSNSKQLPSQNDKLQRPKVVQNATRSIPNRTIIDEVEDFVL